MLPEAGSLIGSDGLHPTEAGYRRIADVFFAAIKRELEER
jgi:lysophospholipase L1-like esterase